MGKPFTSKEDIIQKTRSVFLVYEEIRIEESQGFEIGNDPLAFIPHFASDEITF